jgi:hypothetical protein
MRLRSADRQNANFVHLIHHSRLKLQKLHNGNDRVKSGIWHIFLHDVDGVEGRGQDDRIEEQTPDGHVFGALFKAAPAAAVGLHDAASHLDKHQIT